MNRNWTALCKYEITQYLGPFIGVDTILMMASGEANSVHREGFVQSFDRILNYFLRNSRHE